MLPRIRQTYGDAVDWFSQSIEHYAEDVKEITINLEDYNLKEGYKYHGEGAHARIRGWAFGGVLPYHFPEISRGTLDLKEVLAEADELLAECVRINKQSIGRQANTWGTQRMLQSRVILEALPDYLQDLVAMVSLYKEEKLTQLREYPEILISALYQTQNLGDLRLKLPHVIQKITQSKGIEKRYNEQLSYFQFNIIKTVDGLLKVRFLEQ